MKKRPSVILVFALVFAIISGCLFFKLTTDVGFFKRLSVALIMALSGAIFGAILGLIFRVLFGPNRTQRLLYKQNKILQNKVKNDKLDDLERINILKKSGSITDREYEKLKKEILNR
jgi:hypothetical protein